MVRFPRIELADAVGYLGTAMILGWALLKAAGVIHSPIWVEMIPFVGAGLGVGGILFKAGTLFEKLERVIRDVERLTGKVEPMPDNLREVDYSLIKFEKKLDYHVHPINK